MSYQLQQPPGSTVQLCSLTHDAQGHIFDLLRLVALCGTLTVTASRLDTMDRYHACYVRMLSLDATEDRKSFVCQ